MRWSAWSASRGLTLATMVLFTVMWAAMTYPQVLHMADGVNDVGDPLLNTWALSWVAHQLPFAPAHIFDANIFHPERRTLAYSETLLAPAVVGAPLLWLGAGPVLVYNLLLMAAFVLSGVGTALLVRDLTGRPGAALVAGAIFAFLPFRFDHYAHFQLQHTEWMPLALWAFHRFLRDHRRRYAVALGLAVGGQALTSMYNALFLGAYLAVVGGVVLLAGWRQLPQRVGGLLAAVVLAGALASPVAIAHMRAHDVVGGRSRAEVTSGSAVWTDFLAASPSSMLYGTLSPGLGGPERHLFLGVLGVALSMVALSPPWSAVRLAYAAGLLLSVDMARGLNGWTYGVLYEHFFVFQGLRIPSRMTIMIGLSLAVLAGYGVARVLAGVRSRGTRAAVTAALIAVVAIESWSAPFALALIPREFPQTYADLLADKGEPPRTSVIRRLRDRAPVVIVEFPINREDPTFMYYSTFHWQTLINGYSGFYSARYVMLHDMLKRFPDHQTVEELARLQTRYVVIHGELMPPEQYQQLTARLESQPYFSVVSKRPWQGREISLYRLSF
jgi:hypothetical protein